MNKEELELYKDLQSYLPQDWKVGDWGYVDGGGMCIVTDIYQPYDNLRLWFGDNFRWINHFVAQVFRVPLPIDRQDDERKRRGEAPRGLIEMIKADGKFLCLNEGQEKWRFSITNDGEESKHYYGITPTVAILRALKAQVEERK